MLLARSTRIILETFEAHGVVVKEMVACGGLAERNKLLLEIHGDVTGRDFIEAGSGHASALGAAMLGAAAAGPAAGGAASIADAARRMGPARREVHTPDLRHRATDDRLFAEYRVLHEYFGRGTNGVMQRLDDIRSGHR